VLTASLFAGTSVAWAEVVDARARLADAIQRYLAGDTPGARDELRALLAEGPTLPPDVRREAMAYLGDLLYAEQGEGAAKPIFESLLAEAPNFPMDPFKHPPEVCGYFEDLREARRVALLPVPVPTPEPTPFPLLALAPGGVHWFVDGKPLVGTLVLVAQAGTAAASIVTYAEIQDELKSLPDGDFPEGGNERRAEFERLVWVNRAASTAFWVAYAAPVIVETTAWGAARQVRLQVGPSSVAVTGTF
jgi:hypothetical protein